MILSKSKKGKNKKTGHQEWNLVQLKWIRRIQCGMINKDIQRAEWYD